MVVKHSWLGERRNKSTLVSVQRLPERSRSLKNNQCVFVSLVAVMKLRGQLSLARFRVFFGFVDFFYNVKKSKKQRRIKEVS